MNDMRDNYRSFCMSSLPFFPFEPHSSTHTIISNPDAHIRELIKSNVKNEFNINILQ